MVVMMKYDSCAESRVRHRQKVCLSQIIRGNGQSQYEITFAQSKIKC